jgi:DNA-directed RNA polymerase sigma subunit (sigma70/sigma32)
MHLFLLISILFFSLTINATILLTKTQWSSIRYILQSPETTPELREKTNKIIYEKYEGWSLHQVVKFKKAHPYLCKHISKKELDLYAMQGLCKAIEKYNPEYSFSPYLYIYVQGFLFKGVNQLQPMPNLPLYKRLYKRFSKERKRVRPILLSYEDYWQLEKRQPEPPEFRSSYDDYMETLDNLTISARDKRIFTYKYPYKNGIRTNEYVAELMSLSEETVRTSIIKTMNKMREHNNIMYK